MSLPSPLSVGDALILATVAYNIAKAFKSAPKEFDEIQSLLYSVTESLKLLSRNLPSDDDYGGELTKNAAVAESGNDDTLLVVANILANCRSVLKHLEELVDKYSVLEPV